MKFDYIIGNPPYQGEPTGNSVVMPSIYHYFMDAVYAIADKVELITPAKFLFNAGGTPKAWNEKMLNDEHFKVLFFEADSSKIFAVTNVSGGVAIHYRDAKKQFGKIGIYTVYPELNTIIAKIGPVVKDCNLSMIVHSGRSDLKFNDKFLQDYPESVKLRLDVMQAKKSDVTTLCANEEYELRTTTLDVLSGVFLNEKPDDNDDYYRIFGLVNGQRVSRWIRRCYMIPRHLQDNNVDKYKVVIPLANENVFGGKLDEPMIFGPFETTTPTFISIGKFDLFEDALSCSKYVKTKFLRVLLSVLKITQLNSKPVWKYVPFQDFTSNSDIDWAASIPNIDRQLYRKYGLTQEEIDFIETHVKAMT